MLRQDAHCEPTFHPELWHHNNMRAVRYQFASTAVPIKIANPGTALNPNVVLIRNGTGSDLNIGTSNAVTTSNGFPQANGTTLEVQVVSDELWVIGPNNGNFQVLARY